MLGLVAVDRCGVPRLRELLAGAGYALVGRLNFLLLIVVTTGGDTVEGRGRADVMPVEEIGWNIYDNLVLTNVVFAMILEELILVLKEVMEYYLNTNYHHCYCYENTNLQKLLVTEIPTHNSY